MIPKIIHHIWIQGYDKMPNEDRINVDSIHLLNPDWQHIVWDNQMITQLLSEKYPDLLQIYLGVGKYPSKNKISDFASQSDIARWAIVGMYGGCYMDVDVACIVGLNKLLETVPVEYHTNGIITGKNKNILENWASSQFFISSEKCDAWANVFKYITMAKDKEEIGSAFTNGIRKYPNVWYLPQDILSVYHCGAASMCMIPIKMGATGKDISRTLRYMWCQNKVSITAGATIVIILLIVGLIYYLFRYNKCQQELARV